MKRSFLTIGSAALILLAGAVLFFWQRENTNHLQRQLKVKREAVGKLHRLRSENERRRLMPTASVSAREGEETNAGSTRPRQEVAVAKQPRAVAGVRTRPPGAGFGGMPAPVSMELGGGPKPLRIAEFQNVGQATPAAAFQTTIWAVANADYLALQPLLKMSPAGREKLQAIVGAMPAESQARFQNPNQLIGMLLELELLKPEGYQITGDAPAGAGHVQLRVRRFNEGKVERNDRKIPLQCGPQGWQLEISDEIIDRVPQMLSQVSLYVPPPAK